MNTKANSKTQENEKKESIYKEIQTILSDFPELQVSKKKGANFRFAVYLTPELMRADVDVLDLSVRSAHALRRAKINNIGELCEFVADGPGLKKIRNCGDKSVAEIMDHLFAYHYYHMPEKKRVDYLVKVIADNLKK